MQLNSLALRCEVEAFRYDFSQNSKPHPMGELHMEWNQATPNCSLQSESRVVSNQPVTADQFHQ